MRRIPAVLSPLGLSADRAGWSTLAATAGGSERDRVICPTAIRRELIWDTHEQAHAGVQRVLAKLRLQWYWPSMERDVRLRVKRCEIC